MYPEGYITFPVPPLRKNPPPEGFGDLMEPMEIPKGWNVGVSTNNFGVVDIDRQELIRRFEEKYRECITTVIETPSGGRHYPCSNLVRNEQNDGWDVRGWHGYVLGVGSRTKKGLYRCLTEITPISELKAFPSELFGRKERLRKDGPVSAVIRDARAYVRKIMATSKSGDHNAVFRAACKLADSGMSEVDVFAEMIEWNKSNAGEMYSTRELLHKVRDAFARRKQ
jgi:hypothetical protein